MTLEDLTRKKERRSAERAELDRLLDEVLVGTLATVSDDGRPWAVPLLVARDGDRVLLHGSTGAGALRHVASGTEAVLSVHVVDGLVLATSMFDHSANYRSATIRGSLTTLRGDDAAAALDRLSDALIPGRRDEVRPMTGKDLAATTALALDIGDDNWILKVRTGGAGDDPETAPADVWTGVVPMRTAYGEPERSPWLPDLPVPPSVAVLATGQRSGTNR